MVALFAEILDDLGSTAYYGAMVDSLVGKRYPTGRMGSKTDFWDFGCNQWAKGGISESRKCFCLKRWAGPKAPMAQNKWLLEAKVDNEIAQHVILTSLPYVVSKKRPE